MEKKQRSQLRKIGHPMHALMRVGKRGLSEGFLKELANSLRAHQLVKVSLSTPQREEASEEANAIAAGVDAELVDIVGGSALFYLEDPDDPLVRS
jgi:RNA-binding protein